MSIEKAKVIKEYFDEVEKILKEDWQCDHSIGMCYCDFHEKRHKAEKALAALDEKLEASEFTKKCRGYLHNPNGVNFEPLIEYLGQACDIIDQLAAEKKKLKDRIEQLESDMMTMEINSSKLI